MNNHFKCIGIVGHPRHPTALTTHEMLYRWLCTKGYEVIVEQQIAHELQLKNVKTGTLAEKFMSSKEQKTPEGQAPEEII
ncbi:NAD(+)/NADH kinase, partial [Escherichia sp. R-CC3]